LDQLHEDPTLGIETMDRLFRFYQPRKQGRSKVPVIIETSDFLWSRVQQMSESRESFKPYRVPHFKKEELYNILVLAKDPLVPEQIFTEEEFEKVWEHTGGHHGSLYTLHDALTAGQSFNSIIEEQKSAFYSSTRGTIVGNIKKEEFDAVLQERKQFLKKLQQNNYVLVVEETLKDDIITYFLTKNILFYDGKVVSPQNKPIQDAIEEYLKLHVK
jgi:hypothetical protein